MLNASCLNDLSLDPPSEASDGGRVPVLEQTDFRRPDGIFGYRQDAVQDLNAQRVELFYDIICLHARDSESL